MKGSGLLVSGEIHEFKKKKKHKCNVLKWKFTSSKEQLLKVGEVLPGQGQSQHNQVQIKHLPTERWGSVTASHRDPLYSSKSQICQISDIPKSPLLMR